jgi:carnitine O-acetyltransferase
VSYFFQLDDDKSLQPSTTEALYKNSHFDLGIKRGAASLIAMARYRQLVCSGSLPVERIGKNQTPLCSVAFKYMFHSCRIPHRTSDTFRIYDPSQFKHCIVACKGQFYAMDFVDRNQDPLPLSVLEKGLERCVEMAKSASRDGTSLPELGIFTSGNRDSWADTRDQLLQIGGDKMSSAMDLLESGAFVLCLDDSVS